jgi:hypothetical protein
MREQAVVSHSDAEAQRNPIQRQTDEQCGPAKKEKGPHDPAVKNAKSNNACPVDAISLYEWHVFNFHLILTKAPCESPNRSL